MTAQISTAAAALHAIAGLRKVIFMSVLPPERGCYSVCGNSDFVKTQRGFRGGWTDPQAA